MLCLDWWVWELLILISGWLGSLELATNIIIMNIILITYMMTMGLEQAACTLVGQQIGKGDAESAKKLFGTLLKVSAVMLACTSICLYLLSEKVLNYLTPNP